MLPHEDDITGTDTHAHVGLARPHLVVDVARRIGRQRAPPAGKLTVGRSRKCDLCIDHPSVSREHAVFYGSTPVTVEDLGSTNGTSIAGVRIGARSPGAHRARPGHRHRRRRHRHPRGPRERSGAGARSRA